MLYSAPFFRRGRRDAEMKNGAIWPRFVVVDAGRLNLD